MPLKKSPLALSRPIADNEKKMKDNMNPAVELFTKPASSLPIDGEMPQRSAQAQADPLPETPVSSLAEKITIAAPRSATQPSFWNIVTSTFITIFLAEIGDKTQVSTLLMTAEFHKPWTIFWGAGTALVATTFIGVGVGHWLSARLSPRTLDIAAGLLLAMIAAGLFWEALPLFLPL